MKTQLKTIATAFGASILMLTSCKKDNVQAPKEPTPADISVTAKTFEMTPVLGSTTATYSGDPNTATVAYGTNGFIQFHKVDASAKNAKLVWGSTDIIDGQSSFVPFGTNDAGMKNVRVPNSFQIVKDNGQVITAQFDANTEVFLGNQNPAMYAGANGPATFEKNFEELAAKYATVPIYTAN